MGFGIEKDWESDTKFRCVVIRIEGESRRHRCGYVGVPKEHPLYGTGYNESTELLKSAWEEASKGPIGKRGIVDVFCMAGRKPKSPENWTPGCVFDIHGSLTYSNGDDYPVKGSGLWWFGFDAGHAGDDEDGGRSLPYMESECESLAKQLESVA